MSGSSNRTHSIPPFCHPSRISRTLSTRPPSHALLRRRMLSVPDERRVRYRGGATGSLSIRCKVPSRRRGEGGDRVADAVIDSTGTHVLPLELGRGYPVIVRGAGVWVEDSA